MVNLLKPSNADKRAFTQHLKTKLINPLASSFAAVSTAPSTIRIVLQKHTVPENRPNTFMKKTYNK
ncbi:hypothetical protein Hanom_Chr02g00126141 [Helianthus anomalus]